MMRVLVCGGRDFSDQHLVDASLDEIHAATPIKAIIHGNARGADTCGKVWGDRHPEISVWAKPAQWSKFGKAAGPRRNQAMIGLRPDLVVAFAGGRGTADMIRRAHSAGILVHEIGLEPR